MRAERGAKLHRVGSPVQTWLWCLGLCKRAARLVLACGQTQQEDFAAGCPKAENGGAEEYDLHPTAV